MNPRQDETPGGGPGDSGDRQGSGSGASVPPTGDNSAPSITCRYASRKDRVAACGAFDAEHHRRAAEMAVGCVELAFSDVGQRQDDRDVSAPASPDWPDFEPTDEDVPGGAW